jgi:hypothetical protein
MLSAKASAPAVWFALAIARASASGSVGGAIKSPADAVRAAIVAEYKGEAAMKITDPAESGVRRDSESSTYIYVVLGFTLAIEGTIIQMIEPLHFPCNLAVYVALGAVTTWLFISSGWFQNKLIGIKNSYESKRR